MNASETLLSLFERGMRPAFAPLGGLKPLPELPSSFHGFNNVYSALLECRLGATGGAVDFAWVQFRRDFAVPSGLVSEEPWRALAEFGERWLAGEPAFKSIACIVYEIDQDSGRFGTTPAVFFNRIKGDAASVLTIYRATNALLARPQEPATEAMLARALDLMPPGSIVLCLGYMLSRPTASLRFEITEIEPRRALPVYLRAIGWPGSERAVMAVLDALPTLASDFHVGLAFDVGEAIGPRLGLEFAFKDHADQRAALAGALDDLICAGLCAPGWRATLARWIGRESIQSDWMQAFLPTRATHWRIVSHFKVVLDGPAIEAKCYLECLPGIMLDASRWDRAAAGSKFMMTEAA